MAGKDLDTTAGSGDGRLSGFREAMRPNRDGPGDSPRPSTFTSAPLWVRPAASIDWIGHIEPGGVEGVEVERLVFDPEGVRRSHCSFGIRI